MCLFAYNTTFLTKNASGQIYDIMHLLRLHRFYGSYFIQVRNGLVTGKIKKFKNFFGPTIFQLKMFLTQTLFD